MKLASQIAFEEHIRYTCAGYFGTHNLKDILGSEEHSLNNCNTCKTLHDMLQNIEEDIKQVKFETLHLYHET